jgi:lysyl-tRNA synthetase class 2
MDPLRHAKAEQLRAQGAPPYAARFDRSHTLAEAKTQATDTPLRVAGRVVLLRDMGKLSFLTLQDHTGRFQVVLREEHLGQQAYQQALSLIDLGDHIGCAGAHFTTQKGEPSVLATSWVMLSKALRQPPEKWHGVQDQETAWRQRYLDLTSHRDTFERFTFRSQFIQAIRQFYWQHQFVEVETPVLVNAASGALATPFKTHHEAYDLDVYLRIAPETYLKECLVGGFDRVFELARVFRNEGVDPSHLQDFTMLEHYAAYWDFEANMRFTEELLSTVLMQLRGTTKTQIPTRDGGLVEVDFAPPWPRITLRELILQHSQIDIDQHATADALRAAMAAAGIKLDVDVSVLGRGNLIDQLYKKVARPLIIQPTFVTRHPIDLSPLARRNDENPLVTDRFQLVVGTWEIVNAYSELVDPVDQAQRFDEQAKANAQGDSDAHRKDDAYVTALEYGCPPCSGWGMGIDRIVALLTQQPNLRDVVLFPLMKPQEMKLPQHTNDVVVQEKQASQQPIAATPTNLLSEGGQFLLQHADYGHLLPAAHGLIEAHANQTKAHLIATGAAMEALAKHFGGDPVTWKVAGMLHDLDWDQLEKDYERHCGDTLAHLLSTIDAPAELLGDIRAHYAHKYGAEYPLDTKLRQALYCVDELTGFIIAVTLVRPSKQLADVEVSSVKKKLKDKTFAAQVDREQIRQCEVLLPMPLDSFIDVTLQAMKSVAADLGL